jgi:hypothetical protein
VYDVKAVVTRSGVTLSERPPNFTYRRDDDDLQRTLDQLFPSPLHVRLLKAELSNGLALKLSIAAGLNLPTIDEIAQFSIQLDSNGVAVDGEHINDALMLFLRNKILGQLAGKHTSVGNLNLEIVGGTTQTVKDSCGSSSSEIKLAARASLGSIPVSINLDMASCNNSFMVSYSGDQQAQ